MASSSSSSSSSSSCFSLPAISKTPNPPQKSPKTLTIRSSLTSQPLSAAKSHLLRLISDQNRGIATQSDRRKLSQITEAIDSIAGINRDQITTDASLSGTWRMLWTTEKEQLFIVKNAGVFGTEAGDVLQVIDVKKRSLNNVITFPPDGCSLFDPISKSLRPNVSILGIHVHTF